MQRWPRYFYVCLAALILTVISTAALTPVTVLAYWDNLGGRPILTLSDRNENGDDITFLDEDGNPRNFTGDYTPVFNSIINNSNYGDERNFVSALSAKQDVHADVWEPNTLIVEDGETYFIRMYIHNDNPNGEAATAIGTKAVFSIPEVSGTQIEVGGWINSDNANATQIYDDIVFQSSNDQPFHLEYVYGSAVLWNNGFAGAKGAVIMDDAIVTGQTSDVQTGTLIGYEGFDGKIPGGFEYDQIVCIQVKAVYDYEFWVDVKVRLAGTEDEFAETIEAEVGDKVEFRIEYHNAVTVSDSDAENEKNIQHDVMLKDFLPNNMVYVANTTYLRNANHKNDNEGKGMQLFPDDALFTTGVNIGNYTPNSNAAVYFIAKVVDKDLDDGKTVLVNWAQVSVSSMVHQDHAKTRVQKPETAKTVMRIVIWGFIILCLIDIVRLRRKLRQLRE